MNKEKISYQKLLRDPRWIKRRNEILSRDKNTCQMCGAQDRYLHVHHTKYIVGRKPWEYADDDLVTLCELCHERVHSSEPITDIKVGDIFAYYHSDWCMNYIVYEIDYLREIIYVLGCDDGASFDTTYDEYVFADFLRNKCKIVVEPRSLNYLFEEWFEYVVRNKGLMPNGFQRNFTMIVEDNQIIKDIYNKIEM